MEAPVVIQEEPQPMIHLLVLVIMILPGLVEATGVIHLLQRETLCSRILS